MSWLSLRLQELLKERSLSIQKVGTDLGIERAYLSQIVHAARIPSEDLTRRLAAYFDEDEEEWAFHTKAEPVMEDFRRRYPNMWPKYARNVTDDQDKDPKFKFASSDYLSYNDPSHRDRQVTKFLPIRKIERYASDVLRMYADLSKVDVEDLDFPLDAELLVRKVFSLEVHYDGEGVLDKIDPTLLGCLYADGSPSPWGRDRLIVVNCARRYRAVTDNFTILHESGHYVFHHPIDALSTAVQEGKYCRTDELLIKVKVHPREWQASRFASEVLMPKAKVGWLLDGKQSGEIINLEIYGPRFREYFGVSQAAMEKRLFDLGYRCAFGRYKYANVTQVGTARRQHPGVY